MYHEIKNIEDLTRVVSRITIAADKSPVISKSAEYVGEIFPKADYHVLNVIYINDRAMVLSKGYEHALFKLGEEAINIVMQKLKDGGVQNIHKRILEGRPSKKILQYSKRVNTDIIVIATHSKVGTQSLGIGKTTKNLLERTNIPVLLFPQNSRTEFPKIILNPSSASKYSFRGSMYAVRLAHHFGAKVITLLTEDIPETKLKNIKEYALQMGVNYEIKTSKVKDHAEDIITASKKADLMVMSRGSSGLRYKCRYFARSAALGKLERYVIGNASIPIIVVPEIDPECRL